MIIAVLEKFCVTSTNRLVFGYIAGKLSHKFRFAKFKITEYKRIEIYFPSLSYVTHTAQVRHDRYCEWPALLRGGGAGC